MSQNIIDINKQIQCISLFWEILAQIAKKFKKRYIQEYNSDFGDFHQMYVKFKREKQSIEYYYKFWENSNRNVVRIEWINLELHFSTHFSCYSEFDGIHVVVDKYSESLGTLSSNKSSEIDFVIRNLHAYLLMFKDMKVDLSRSMKKI